MRLQHSFDHRLANPVVGIAEVQFLEDLMKTGASPGTTRKSEDALAFTGLGLGHQPAVMIR